MNECSVLSKNDLSEKSEWMRVGGERKRGRTRKKKRREG